MAAAEKQEITRTAQVAIEPVTVPALTEAAAKVGAPATATVAIVGSVPRSDGNGNVVYVNGVTFSWVELV